MTALGADVPAIPEGREPGGPGPGADAAVKPGEHVFRRMAHDPNVCAGGIIVGLFVSMALLAPLIAPEDPLRITAERLRPPSMDHLLGTDGLGRDMLSRIMFGARNSLGTAALAGLLVMTIGVFVGTVAGFFGGFVDSVLMRVVDVIIALPGLMLSFAIAGLFEPSLLAVMMGLVTVWWVGYARIVRSLVLSAREKAYIDAARALGAGHARVIVRHILPNIMPSVIVLVTMRMARLILAIAGLNFLGLGAQPPTPEWGAMLNESRPYFPSFPHIMFVPGVTIVVMALGLNLLGDGLRDVLDPRLKPQGGSGP